eukprot:1017173-Rhodomonas_salina.2
MALRAHSKALRLFRLQVDLHYDGDDEILCDVAPTAIRVRACYAMSSTDRAYRGIRWGVCCVLT